MNKSILGLLLAATLGLAVSAGVPSTARADTYWTNHWGWYDNTYRPYYQQRYYSSPAYNYPPPAYYGPTYNASPYYYNTRPYYGTGVQVGPLQFGWW
jgi:hypothetical protein